mmetsp:Transcript_35360/g.77348  ORF Transcript_35360/g.77348 Transcript_35360/m.77348 type:complete len:86 (-) Transcript_35360:316-573(-)
MRVQSHNARAYGATRNQRSSIRDDPQEVRRRAAAASQRGGPGAWQQLRASKTLQWNQGICRIKEVSIVERRRKCQEKQGYDPDRH